MSNQNMENLELRLKNESERVGFREFLRGLFHIIKMTPSLLKGIKDIRKLKPDSNMSLGSSFEENAKKHANNTALLFESERYTYREFNERANKIANYFISQGAKKGETAALLTENRPELLFCVAGLAKVGVVSSLINSNLRGPALKHCLDVERPDSFIIDEGLVDAFEEIRPELSLNATDKVYFLSCQSKRSAPEGYVNLSAESFAAQVSNPAMTGEIQAKDTLCYVFTSGTTGKPKAAVIDHHRWLSSKFFFGAEMSLKPDDTLYVPLPFNHGTALIVAWAAAARGGAAVLTRRKFSAGEFWKDVKKHKVTAFAYIGELCRYLMNSPLRPEDADNTVEKIIGNGLRPDIWKDFKKRFDIPKVYEFYAASEGNATFSNMMNLDETIGFDFRSHAIVKYDAEADEPLKDNNGFLQKAGKREAGLLLSEISEDNPFVGYANKDDNESKIIRNAFKKGDAWFNTGDLIKDIGFGNVRFVDRVGDTFRRKGENVSTLEVEEAINAFDQVRDSAVYGVAIPGVDGRVGMAALIASTTPENFDFKKFASELRQALPTYAVPVFIRFQKEFEATATMKRIKSRLRQEGFDLRKTRDPLYASTVGKEEYAPLTESLRAEIVSGERRF